MSDKYISALEQCKNIDINFVIDCWSRHSHLSQRDIGYMFYGAMLMIKSTDHITYEAMFELWFLNDISLQLEKT